MQPTHRSARILLPAKTWFIYLTLSLAVLLNYIPTGRLPGVPDSIVLVLTFWCIREPSRIGMTAGFMSGLLMDVAQGAAMGQHALAYVILAYCATALARRILWFSPSQQALHILPLLLMTQTIMVAIRMAAGASFPGWYYFLSSFVGMLLWTPLSFLLLLPQYQPVERDDNRPI